MVSHIFVLDVADFPQDHPTISFKDVDPPSPRQHVTVPFEVPYVQILHTVRMHHRAGLRGLPDYVAIGSALPLRVVIRHTRQWWGGDIRSGNDGNALVFQYEVHALPDDWIIGGQKKGHFSAQVSYSIEADQLVAHQYERQMKHSALQSFSYHNVQAI